ncbi:MAG: hypothetical protein U0325_29675 [Polyangiales bacterium]
MTRNLLLSLTALAAISTGACATTPAPQAQVTVAAPAPQPVVQQPVYQQPAVPIVAVPGAVVGGGGVGSVVGPTWTANGMDAVGQNMTLRARQFASGFTAVTDMIRSTMRQGREGVTVPGTVGPGFCYRVISVGGTGISDLDMFLLDTSGRQIDADRAPDNYPVIGLSRPLCVPPGAPPITAQIRIRAFSGSGEIGVQIFATPYNGQLVGTVPAVIVQGR